MSGHYNRDRQDILWYSIVSRTECHTIHPCGQFKVHHKSDETDTSGGNQEELGGGGGSIGTNPVRGFHKIFAS